jgi:THAP domain
MAPCCSVRNCYSRKGGTNQYTIYPLPEDETQKQKWAELGNFTLSKNEQFVCFRHFENHMNFQYLSHLSKLGKVYKGTGQLFYLVLTFYFLNNGK